MHQFSDPGVTEARVTCAGDKSPQIVTGGFWWPQEEEVFASQLSETPEGPFLVEGTQPCKLSQGVVVWSPHPGQGMHSRIKARRGLGIQKAKKRRQCCTKG